MDEFVLDPSLDNVDLKFELFLPLCTNTHMINEPLNFDNRFDSMISKTLDKLSIDQYN